MPKLNTFAFYHHPSASTTCKVTNFSSVVNNILRASAAKKNFYATTLILVDRYCCVVAHGLNKHK